MAVTIRDADEQSLAVSWPMGFAFPDPEVDRRDAATQILNYKSHRVPERQNYVRACHSGLSSKGNLNRVTTGPPSSDEGTGKPGLCVALRSKGACTYLLYTALGYDGRQHRACDQL